MNQTEINAANASATARLEGLVGRLKPGDVDMDLGDGWTIGTAFAHLVFWDRRAGILLGRWEQGLILEHENLEWYDTMLNEVLEPLLTRLPSDDMPRLAVEAAHLVDDKAASMSPALIQEIVARGDGWLLNRTNHRLEHVEQIEAALGGA